MNKSNSRDNKPRVSIGLPVYNGENYLEEALESILAQTFTDFELIVSDNASIDRTQEICRTYEIKDERIRYIRNETNIGANGNFNRVFELSSGEYFKWTAHDDVYAPEFVERCVDVLDHDPSVVLCFSKTKHIDEHGQVLGIIDVEVDSTSSNPTKRFYNMIHFDHGCFQIFGVLRAEKLRLTNCLGQHYGADRVLLAELSLLGRIYELDEYLFLKRGHNRTSWQIVTSGKNQELVAYFGSNRNIENRFLGIKNFHGYFTAINRAPLDFSVRQLCYLQLLRLGIEKSGKRFRKKYLSLGTM